jgi:hypothetical protein
MSRPLCFKKPAFFYSKSFIKQFFQSKQYSHGFLSNMQSSAPFAVVEKSGSDSSQHCGDAIIDVDIDIGSRTATLVNKDAQRSCPIS